MARLELGLRAIPAGGISIEALTDKLEAVLWSPRVHGLSRGVRYLIKILRFIYAVLRDAIVGNLPMRSMGLVYVTILSIVPLLAISFSVLKGFGFHRQLEPVLYRFLSPLGDRGIELTNQVISFVDNIKGDVLAGVGLSLLFITTISMANKIEDSFNFVWRVERSRNIAQRFSQYLSVILVGPVIMVTALALLASIRNADFLQSVFDIQAVSTTLLFMGKVSPYILVILGFSFVYWFLPNTRVRIAAALVGGTVGGLLWATAGLLVTTFVAESARALSIYASFAIVLIAMIWLYLCWLILLLGAQVAYYFQHPEHLRLGYRPLNIGSRQREQIALSVMSLVAEAFRAGNPAPKTEDISGLLKMPSVAMGTTLQRLEADGLLVRTEKDELLPGRDPQGIRLTQVLSAVREPLDTDMFPEGRWPAVVDRVSSEAEKALAENLGERTVYDLLETAPG